MELVRKPVDQQRRCALYRHFDDQDVLLYVGITDTLGERTNNGHARTSDWVQFAERAEAEWYDTREEASAAEREAVRGERPVFNRQYAEWDVDRQVMEYLHQREVAELRATIEEYQRAASRLFAALPAQDYRAAEEMAADDYECAGHALDARFMASILRHVARRIEGRTIDVRDEATADAFRLIAQFAAQQIEAIDDRRKAAMECPF